MIVSKVIVIAIILQSYLHLIVDIVESLFDVVQLFWERKEPWDKANPTPLSQSQHLFSTETDASNFKCSNKSLTPSSFPCAHNNKEWFQDDYSHLEIKHPALSPRSMHIKQSPFPEQDAK